MTSPKVPKAVETTVEVVSITPPVVEAPAKIAKVTKAVKAAKVTKAAKAGTPAGAEAEKPAKVKEKKEKEKEKEKERKKAKKKAKKSKEAVIIRFDDEQLPQIDARAEAIGLSRAAWVRMVVAQALAKG
ncbi:Histone H1 [Candidatus Terasakiella magnetica]|nr:Histone H1 [Candidatus Terasakiella magnetica]